MSHLTAFVMMLLSMKLLESVDVNFILHNEF